MAANIERFKSDLDRLSSVGELLYFSMLKAHRPDWLKSAAEKLDSESAARLLQRLPDFKAQYNIWYSEALALVRQILPDRLADFVALYEKPKGRKSITVGNYCIQDYLQNLMVSDGFGRAEVTQGAAIPQFEQQLIIVRAATSRFASSLFEIRRLVQADLFDTEIDSAREVLKNGFLRAAGAISGVVLEKHLWQVCADHGIPVKKKHPTIGELNELLKSNEVIDVPQWRHIGMLADIRNICDHKREAEPTREQVADLIDGTDKVLKTIA